MKKLLKLSLLVLCSFSFGAQATTKASGAKWTALYQKLKPSVPFIFSDGGLCSGALIAPTLILTAKHCVDSLRPTFVAWPENNRSWEQVRIRHVSEKLDFALLELREPSNRKVIPIRKGKEILEGESVATMGHPTSNRPFSSPPFHEELTHVFSAGIVSKNTGKELVSDLSLSPGNSGGPMFDDNGEIVGVVSRKVITPFFGNVGYAVGHNAVKAALLLKDSDSLSWPSLSDIPPNMSLFFQLAWDSYQNDVFNYASVYRSEFGLEYTIADRLFVNYINSFGLHDVYTRSWGVGYKLHYIGPNLVPIYVKPQISTVKYSVANSDAAKHAVGYSSEFGMSGLPMALRLTWLRAQGENHFSLGLKLFGL